MASAMTVRVYFLQHHTRSRGIAHVMYEGIRKSGEIVTAHTTGEYKGPDGDVAVFYGFERGLEKIFADYRAAGKPVVYVDLGYWSRQKTGHFDGYHKVAINSRHPTAYFQNVRHDASRLAGHGIEIKPWRQSGDFILLAGMSDRAALVAGFQPEEWERAAVAELRRHTDMPIVYRPKPNYLMARPIEGTIFAHKKTAVTDALQCCHAVVSHHSNVGVEALIHGVPSFTKEGAALPLSQSDFSKICDPRLPDDRQQWLQDLSYCQWHVEEMRTGAVWAHLKSEGLLS